MENVNMQAAEPVVVPGEWHLTYSHSAGRAGSAFLHALREDARLLGTRCDRCERVLIPPRAYCERCFVPTADEMVDVGPEGVVESFTVTYSEFPTYPEPPYALAYVRPDGASTAICNFLKGVDLSNSDDIEKHIHIGQRVRAHFGTKRKGHMFDFWWVPA